MARRILPRPAGSRDSSSIPSMVPHTTVKPNSLPARPWFPKGTPAGFPSAPHLLLPPSFCSSHTAPFLLFQMSRPVSAQHPGLAAFSFCRMLLPELLADSLPHIIRVLFQCHLVHHQDPLSLSSLSSFVFIALIPNTLQRYLIVTQLIFIIFLCPPSAERHCSVSYT